MKLFIAIRHYVQELESIDLTDYNHFIINNLMTKILKSGSLLPVMITIAVLLFSMAIQQSIYIFIPQSSITSYATYTVFNFAISLVVLLIYPILIILLINYLGAAVKHLLPGMFSILKILVLVVIFFGGAHFLIGKNFQPKEKFMLTMLWLAFYFALTNIYLAYTKHKNIFRLGKARVVLLVFFSVLMVRPFIFVYIHTSEMINFTSINASVYLTAIQCKLISRPLKEKGGTLDNLTINSEYVEHTTEGCYINENLIRYGFGSDFVIIFKKNLHPVTINNQLYNYYVRLNCYAGNCFAEDNIKTLADHDLYNNLINSTKRKD